jgi:hypothetical protein
MSILSRFPARQPQMVASAKLIVQPANIVWFGETRFESLHHLPDRLQVRIAERTQNGSAIGRPIHK